MIEMTQACKALSFGIILKAVFSVYLMKGAITPMILPYLQEQRVIPLCFNILTHSTILLNLHKLSLAKILGFVRGHKYQT